MELVAFLGFFNVLIYFGLLIFGVYFVITVMHSMKKRNEYLKDIRDELKEFNKTKIQQP